MNIEIELNVPLIRAKFNLLGLVPIHKYAWRIHNRSAAIYLNASFTHITYKGKQYSSDNINELYAIILKKIKEYDKQNLNEVGTKLDTKEIEAKFNLLGLTKVNIRRWIIPGQNNHIYIFGHGMSIYYKYTIYMDSTLDDLYAIILKELKEYNE